MPEKILNTAGVNNVPFMAETSGNSNEGGAYVLWMILSCDKVKANPVPTTDALFTEAQGKNDLTEEGFWYVDPQGLMQTANAHDPRGSGWFLDYSRADRDSANAKLVYTVDHYEVPPAVIIGGGPQWVAVTGYNTDGGGALNWLNIHDPAFDAGTGPFYVVNASIWNDVYFRHVTGGTRWKDKFGMICDPEPKTAEVKPPVRRPRAAGKELIKPEQAVEFATAELRERGLAHHAPFAQALERAKPGRPVLVQSLEVNRTAYYVIPWNVDGKSMATVALDARYGDFWCATANPPAPPLIRLTPRDVVRNVTERPIPIYEHVADVRNRLMLTSLAHLERARTREIDEAGVQSLRRTLDRQIVASRRPVEVLHLEESMIEVGRNLVWAPSSSSTSPLQPFYRVISGTRQILVRASDGLIVTDFHPWLLETMGG